MFSGIVETTSRIAGAEMIAGNLRIKIEKPSKFNDLNSGDSVSVDGICLTVEAFSDESIQFSLGAETLRVTGWTAETVLGRAVNLERSLKLGDRIHGHLVTGHADCLATVLAVEKVGDGLRLTIEVPELLQSLIWSKGSVTVNGVSLTVNQRLTDSFQVGLIPETLKRTNLSELQPGVKVVLEADNMARGLVHLRQLQREMAQ